MTVWSPVSAVLSRRRDVQQAVGRYLVVCSPSSLTTTPGRRSKFLRMIAVRSESV